MNTKSAFVAIIGRPNVGKSSLLNYLLGRKIAIVSPKPQTTRNRITGVLTEGDTQYVFIDTPGMHMPRTTLGGIMVKAINDTVSDIDAAVLVVEPVKEPTKAELGLIEKLKDKKIPAILAVNKIDSVKNKEDLLPAIEAYSSLLDFAAIVPISAKTGENVGVLKEEISKYAAESPFFFDADTLTDQPERVIAAEVIREKMLRLLDKEIPHGTAVVIESMKERENSDLMDIEATIYCERESHKAIIIGKKGSMLKKIGQYARHDMEDFFGCRINLNCWVKVKEGWRNRIATIHNLGLDM